MPKKQLKEESTDCRNSSDFHSNFWVFMWVSLIVLVVLSILFENTSNEKIFGALWAVWTLCWVFLVFFLRRHYLYRFHRWYPIDEAEEELRLRFAKGEISKKEFEERLKELRY